MLHALNSFFFYTQRILPPCTSLYHGTFHSCLAQLSCHEIFPQSLINLLPKIFLISIVSGKSTVLSKYVQFTSDMVLYSSNHRIPESQNHGKVWAGRHLKDCLPWAGMSPTWLGYSGPHPTWPWRLSGMGNTSVSFLASLLSGFCFKIFLPETSVRWWMSRGIPALIRWHSRKRFFFLCLHIVLRRKHCLCSAQHCDCAKSFMNP